jgi:hypothetical protein
LGEDSIDQPVASGATTSYSGMGTTSGFNRNPPKAINVSKFPHLINDKTNIYVRPEAIQTNPAKEAKEKKKK